MGHHESLGRGALLIVLFHKRIMLGYLPLLVVETMVGLILLQTLSVAVDVLVLVIIQPASSAFRTS